MAKHKVLNKFRDKETGRVHEPGDVIDVTIARAKEMNTALDDFEFVERYNEDENED